MISCWALNWAHTQERKPVDEQAKDLNEVDDRQGETANGTEFVKPTTIRLTL